MLAKPYENLLGGEVGLWIVVDFEDLHGTLSTCCNAADKSIQGYVLVIKYEFETGNISRVIWIPGRFTYADPLSKNDSLMATSLS